MAVLLGLLSGIVYGAADFCGGLSTKRNPMVRVVLLSQLAGFVVYLVAVPLLPEGRFTAGAWAWGGLSGLAGAVGIGFLYAGLARGRMSVVAPTAAVVFAVVPLAFGLLRGERPTALQLVGVAVALPAVALVSTARDPDAFLGSGRSATLARMRSTGVPEAVAAGVGPDRVGGDLPRRRAGLPNAVPADDGNRRDHRGGRRVRRVGQPPLPAGHPGGAAFDRRRADRAVPGHHRDPGPGPAPGAPVPLPGGRPGPGAGRGGGHRRGVSAHAERRAGRTSSARRSRCSKLSPAGHRLGKVTPMSSNARSSSTTFSAGPATTWGRGSARSSTRTATL